MSRDIEITRETDDAVYFTTQWCRSYNAERDKRRLAGEKLESWERKRSPTKAIKYVCVGGPLHGKKYASIQMPGLGQDGEGYFDYNKAGYDTTTPKMIRIHFTLLEQPPH